MSKNSLVLLLGGFIVVASFLGIPSSWKTIVFSILGVAIIVVALLLRRDITSGILCMRLTKEKQTDSYMQNGALRSNDNQNSKIHDDEKKEHKKEYEQVQHTTKPQT